MGPNRQNGMQRFGNSQMKSARIRAIVNVFLKGTNDLVPASSDGTTSGTLRVAIRGRGSARGKAASDGARLVRRMQGRSAVGDACTQNWCPPATNKVVTQSGRQEQLMFLRQAGGEVEFPIVPERPSSRPESSSRG